MKNNLFNFTLILIQDPKSKGYTAFFKQIPNIISEGETENDAINNLSNAVYDIFK